MPICEECQTEIPPGAVTCPVCQEQATQLAEEAKQNFLNYDGEDYLTRAFLEDGQSEDDARREVQDPSFLRLCLEFGGLEYLLKDRWATRGLVTALTNRDAGVLKSLEAYVSRRAESEATEAPVHAKPGPKSDPATGKYKYEIAAELREQGHTLGQIALRLYENPKQANRVAALLSRRRAKP
jgi:uncharacterized Zn finger protein (UPF0148 family)